MNRKLLYAAAIIGGFLTTGIAHAGVSFHFGHHGHNYRPYYGYPYGHYYGYQYGYYRPYRHYGYRSYGRQRYDADTPYSSTVSGWKLLSEGKSAEALRVFSSQAQSNPKDGVPKAGYAIAAAANGDLAAGIGAMRRAFRIDPKSLHYVSVDAELEAVLHDLAARYENYGPDGAFMQAAFAYLRRDYAIAAVQIDAAVSAGDKHKSTRKLRKLLAKTDQPVAGENRANDAY